MTDKVGAVMVVGGGISGIQSALDLAESGYKVYLVDNSPSIGGVMAQLDKTFPTNDCSMCILAPKLVAAGSHHNIELMTCSDVLNVEGEPGNFNVSVLKRAKYVDLDKCTGCGECIQECPVQVPDEFNEELDNRKAIYLKFPQAVPLKVTVEKAGVPPCKDACPAHVNGQGYVALIKMGKHQEALNLIRERCVLPSIIGRICHHPCEEACNRKDHDEAINICSLKRFAADYVRDNLEDPAEFLEDKKTDKVAIVGAGPAGLTVAYHLGRLGYPVTIFEKEPVVGGMLRLGIPDYRLPPEILEADVAQIKKYGVEIKTNSPVGEAGGPSIKDLKNEYKAVFIGVGLPDSRKLNIEGENLANVIPGTDFLKDVNLGKPVTVGKKVIVIGGGNVAVDVGRSALRKGAEEVHLVMLESEDIIPAHSWEVEEAKDEGIQFHCSRGPKRFIGTDGKVTGLETLECGSVFDDDGKFNPVLNECTEQILGCDMIIVAIGQSANLNFLDAEINRSRGIEINRNNFATNMPGVFAGGEIVTGPGSAIEAMAIGNKAAMVMDMYCKGQDISTITETIPDYDDEPKVTYSDFEDLERFPNKARFNNPMMAASERKTSFAEFTKGLTEEQAIEEAERCMDCGICSECFECVRVCQAEALDHCQQDETVNVNVGAVILSPGFDEFDPSIKSEYSYATAPNVVTSIEYERILSASGPYSGHIKRPSDGVKPKKIAFIQCVGSRDEQIGNDFCSGVCCMYAMKEAVITKEHERDIDPTIFYMDIRAFGKEFDDYYNRAKDEYKLRFVRSRVAGVEEDPETNDLTLHYIEDGDHKEEKFDLVVLSVGLESIKGAQEVKKAFGIELDNWNFCETDPLKPVETSRPGIFVSGAFCGPKDIPDTVAQASAAAAKASATIHEARGTLVTAKEYPPEKDVVGQEPRIGVFICHCGTNIGGWLDVPDVVEYVKSLPGVVYAGDNLYTCSADTQVKIKEIIEEHNLNRVIVASCTPRTHEPLFQETLREAGLNPFLFEMANIRDQCSWIHMDQRDKATTKAEDLVRMSVAKAAMLESLQVGEVPVVQKGLVIGGGPAGMQSALDLAAQGFETYLIEREGTLGGHMKHELYMLEDVDPQERLRKMIDSVEANPKIHVLTNAKIVDIDGYVGNFKTTVDIGGSPTDIEHGTIIVATGGGRYTPTEYMYGQSDRVYTHQSFEKAIEEYNGQSTVFIQCVGSRTPEQPWCSRSCCNTSIKQALEVKNRNPSADVYVLYRDIRTYSLREKYYTEALEKGVKFINYELDEPPVVTEEGGRLAVKIVDRIEGFESPLKIPADALVLANAITPHADNEELAKMLKIPISKDGFFLEAHMKLRPVEFATEGVYLAGHAHAPKNIDEILSQASAAASRASTVLSRDMLSGEGIVAEVNETLCNGCGICVPVCAYKAITIEDVPDAPSKKVAIVNEVMCKACGACVGCCPSGALEQKGFLSRQIVAMIDALLDGEVK